MTSFDDLTTLSIRSLTDLLQQFDLTAELRANEEPGSSRWIMSSISFVGEGIRGAVTLVSDSGFWRRYALATGLTEVTSEALLCDSAGELVNMTMGRIRKRLLAHDIDARQATPTCAFGDDLVFRNAGGAQSRWSRLAVGETSLFLRLDAQIEISLANVASEETQALQNDLVFF